MEYQRKSLNLHLNTIFCKEWKIENNYLNVLQSSNASPLRCWLSRLRQKKMDISPSEMRKRLDKVGLIKSLIQDCYDTLHTESREAVASDVVEALKNWERKE